MEPNNNPPKRRRARKADGTYRANNPETKTNEAWEPVEVETSLPKKQDYSIKPKVGGPSATSGGKYSKKPSVRPTFGKVTSTTS